MNRIGQRKHQPVADGVKPNMSLFHGMQHRKSWELMKAVVDPVIWKAPTAISFEERYLFEITTIFRALGSTTATAMKKGAYSNTSIYDFRNQGRPPLYPLVAKTIWRDAFAAQHGRG